ncbi:MAG TPA: hypothetical protein VMC84_12370 [Methanocella sp.]|uniref:hypothetical protein n=1 Tax=Methanocella sp. TaxID=2052833 RepID=UPI002BBD104B|nr:hypothetical protein [Methanocella sp.]HTY91962.1 hypothetical protein [Methanocella sp.]
MELPHGVLVRSFKGPVPLAELNAALLKDSFTGFMRASLFAGSTFAEGAIVYGAGKPIIAYVSDGKSDHQDGEQKVIATIASSEDTVLELFSLNEGQLRLAADFGKEFMIRQAPAQQTPKPPVEAPKPMPVKRQPPAQRSSMPEVRGSFIKSESVVSLKSYIENRKDETGHAVLIKQDGGECHLLLLHGKVVAAYSAGEAGEALLGKMLSSSGVAEFYHIDEALINSIMRMYPHVALGDEPSRGAPKAEPAPQPMQVLRPDSKPYVPLIKPVPIAKSEGMAHGTVTRPPEQPGPMETHRFDASPKHVPGVSAKALFDKGARQAADGIGTPAPESKSTGALKGDMEDDADYVKKVENEFVGNVDDLLKRLELSHLKVVPDKKKRT